MGLIILVEPRALIPQLLDPSLLQSSPIEQGQELIHRSHVDGLCCQVALAIINETFWDSVHLVEIVDLPAWIKQDRIRIFMLSNKGVDLRRRFV